MIDYKMIPGEYCFPGNHSIGINPIRQMFLLSMLDKYSQTHDNVNILEVGCWLGSSTVIFLSKAVEFFKSINMYCCDMWEPYRETDPDKQKGADAIMNDAFESGIAREVFKHNVGVTGQSVTMLDGDSRKVLPTLEDGFFDIIFIDGNHLYEYVKNDMKEAKRLIKPGGFICGDDLEISGHMVDGRDIDKECVHNELYKGHYHPGVSLAHFEEFGVTGTYEGFWCVENVNNIWRSVDLRGIRCHLPPFMVSDECSSQFWTYMKKNGMTK